MSAFNTLADELAWAGAFDAASLHYSRALSSPASVNRYEFAQNVSPLQAIVITDVQRRAEHDVLMLAVQRQHEILSSLKRGGFMDEKGLNDARNQKRRIREMETAPSLVGRLVRASGRDGEECVVILVNEHLFSKKELNAECKESLEGWRMVREASSGRWHKELELRRIKRQGAFVLPRTELMELDTDTKMQNNLQRSLEGRRARINASAAIPPKATQWGTWALSQSPVGLIKKSHSISKGKCIEYVSVDFRLRCESACREALAEAAETQAVTIKIAVADLELLGDDDDTEVSTVTEYLAGFPDVFMQRPFPGTILFCVRKVNNLLYEFQGQVANADRAYFYDQKK